MVAEFDELDLSFVSFCWSELKDLNKQTRLQPKKNQKANYYLHYPEDKQKHLTDPSCSMSA